MGTTLETAWKVTVDDRSAIVSIRGQRRHYRKGVPVRPLPNMGPLMAFKYKIDAQAFAEEFVRRGYRIRRARVRISDTCSRSVLSCWATAKQLKRFWAVDRMAKVLPYYTHGQKRTPAGTIFCDEITCLD